VKEIIINLPTKSDLTNKEVYKQIAAGLGAMSRFLEEKSNLENPKIIKSAIVIKDLNMKLIVKPDEQGVEDK
jgi:hypothetical protein